MIDKDFSKRRQRTHEGIRQSQHFMGPTQWRMIFTFLEDSLEWIC